MCPCRVESYFENICLLSIIITIIIIGFRIGVLAYMSYIYILRNNKFHLALMYISLHDLLLLEYFAIMPFCQLGLDENRINDKS